MNSVEYEQIIKEIVKSIAEKVEQGKFIDIQSGRKNLIKGVSGYKHQIDVAVKAEKVLLLVECKYWNRKVSVGSVLSFLGRIKDISPTSNCKTQGVMVTNKGFQSGARIIAKYFDIDLQIIKSANEFGFKYKNLLLIHPAPAVSVASVSNITVIIE